MNAHACMGGCRITERTRLLVTFSACEFPRAELPTQLTQLTLPTLPTQLTQVGLRQMFYSCQPLRYSLCSRS
jgi:hypothetical protein